MAKAYSSYTIVDLLDDATYIYYASAATIDESTGLATGLEGVRGYPNSDTKYIGFYYGNALENGRPDTPPAATTWTKYVADALTVTGSEIRYALSTSGTTKPYSDTDTTNWKTTITAEYGKYLWTQTKTTYSAGPATYSYSVGYLGTNGTNATQYYAFVRYSANANGSNMTTAPSSTTKYVGFYSGTSSSPAYTAYTWSEYVGTDGIQYYSFVRYATDSSGTGMTTTPSSSTKYVGFYNGTKASPVAADYTWSKYIGEDGKSTYFGYLTNEAQTFAAKTATTTTTQVKGLYGTSDVTVTLKTINGKAVATSDTETGITGINFKVSSTSATTAPTITFTTTTSLAESQTGQIPIIYRLTGESADRTSYFSYSTTKNGTNGTSASLVDITPSAQIFKSTNSGSSYTPTSITLTPRFQNVSYSSWQYSVNGGSTWTAVTSGSNGLTINNGVLTVASTSALYTSSVTSLVFKCISSNSAVADTVTLSRVVDGKNGTNGNSPIFQYSTDGKTYETYNSSNASKYQYMRVSTDGGSTYGQPIYFKGPSGEKYHIEVDYPHILRYSNVVTTGGKSTLTYEYNHPVINITSVTMIENDETTTELDLTDSTSIYNLQLYGVTYEGLLQDTSELWATDQKTIDISSYTARNVNDTTEPYYTGIIIKLFKEIGEDYSIEVANASIEIKNGVPDDLLKFQVNARNITAAVENKALIFDDKGVTIYTGNTSADTDNYGIKIIKGGTLNTSTGYIENGTSVFYADSNGDLYLQGTIFADGGYLKDLTVTGKLNLASRIGAVEEDSNIIIDGPNGEIYTVGFEEGAEDGWKLEKEEGAIYANKIHLGTAAYIDKYIRLGPNAAERNAWIFNPQIVKDSLLGTNGAETTEHQVYSTGDAFVISNNISGNKVFSINTDGTLWLGNHNNNRGIILDGSSEQMRSSSYLSGYDGWKIDVNEAEFNNVTVRGSIKSSVMEYGKVQSVGGVVLVRPSTAIKRIGESQNTATVANKNLFQAKKLTKYASYDEKTNTYTIKGSGTIYSTGFTDRIIEVPFGKAYQVTMEVYSPIETTFGRDDNERSTGTVSYTGDDFTGGHRGVLNLTVPANSWTKIGWYAENVSSYAKNQSIYVYTSWGSTSITSDQTYQVRNIKVEIVDPDNYSFTDWSPSPVDAASGSWTELEVEDTASLNVGDICIIDENQKPHKIIAFNGNKVYLDGLIADNSYILTAIQSATTDSVQNNVGIIINSSSNASFGAPHALSIAEYTGDYAEGEYKEQVNLILGQLDGIVTPEQFGYSQSKSTHYGLYATDAYLNGAIVSYSSANNYSAGINTNSEVYWDTTQSKTYFPSLWTNSSAATASANPNLGPIVFWAGTNKGTGSDLQGANFKIDAKGNFYANSAYIQGSIISDSYIEAAEMRTALITGTGGSGTGLTFQDIANAIVFKTGSTEKFRVSSTEMRTSLPISATSGLIVNESTILGNNSISFSGESLWVYSNSKMRGQIGTKDIVAFDSTAIDIAPSSIINLTSANVNVTPLEKGSFKLVGAAGYSMDYQRTTDGYNLYIH